MANVNDMLDKLLNGHRLVTIRNWIKTYFVRKDGDKGLSTNDFTDEMKAKVECAASQADLEELAKKTARVYIPKGSLDTYDDLANVENPEYGWTYNIRDTGKNYMWCKGDEGEEDFWDDLGGDLTDYVRKEEIVFLTEEEVDIILGVCNGAEAFDTLIAAGGEITLEADIAISGQKIFTKDTVIDLNGHAITSAYTGILFLVNGVTLTLKGEGSITTAKRLGHAINGGEIVIESGTYTSGNEAFRATGEGSKLTMNGGAINSVEGALIAFTKAEIEMNGGVITTSDNFGIATNGSSGVGGNKITMNGGRLNCHITTPGYEAIGIYIANNDVFVMNGGEVYAYGGTGLCMRAGNVTIHDGVITATAPDGPDGQIADDPTIMTGTSAVIYDERAGYPGRAGMSLTITGGVFTGVDHALEILSDEETPNVTVTGGTFHPAYPED